jgi:hypothetical protein
MSPVKYELGIYIPEDGILYRNRRGNLKPYMSLDTLPKLLTWFKLTVLVAVRMTSPQLLPSNYLSVQFSLQPFQNHFYLTQ